MKTKNVAASDAHRAFMDDMKGVLKTHGEKLSAQELLAVTSQLVGQILALQDQRTMTPKMGLEIIGCNIEIGNAVAMQDILGTPANVRPA